MKNCVRRIAVVLVIATGAGPLAGVAAGTAELPAASRYYPFLGDWHGRGRLSEPGQAPVSLKLRLSCRKASSGWAVRCAMVARNDKLTLTESDLMGVDPVTGTGHWYAVTNQGETHDHITQWPAPGTMKAHHSWVQNNRMMLENISFTFSGKKSVKFHSVVTADGKVSSEFSGELTR